jgi:hypothetical protein
MFFNPDVGSSSPRVPLLNAIQNISYLPMFQRYNQLNRKKRLMFLVKRTAEAMSIVNHIVDDILAMPYFIPADSSDTGRNKILKAQKFAKDMKYRKLMRSVILDVLITGEGFLWKGALDDKSLAIVRKEMQKGIKSALQMEMKEDSFEYKDMFNQVSAQIESDLITPKKLRTIASSTVSIVYDKYDTLGYSQYVQGQTINFADSEVIRFTIEQIDGYVEGWTPLMSMPIHLELLWLMWLNQYYLQKKGNHPDKVFIAENLDTNHPSYKKLEATLEQYNQPYENNHGSLLLTGKMDVIDIQKIDSLQFRDVGLYIATLIAQQWKYPLAGQGIKTAEAASSKDSNGSGDRGYWKKIEQMQQTILETVNTELWEPYFGVCEQFDQSYLHDEVVETQTDMQNLNNLEIRMRLLSQIGKKIKPEIMVRIMNRDYDDLNFDEDLEDVTEEDKMNGIGGQTGMLRQGLQSNAAVANRGSGTADRANKRSDELIRERNTGKPTGVG